MDKKTKADLMAWEKRFPGQKQRELYGSAFCFARFAIGGGHFYVVGAGRSEKSLMPYLFGVMTGVVTWWCEMGLHAMEVIGVGPEEGFKPRKLRDIEDERLHRFVTRPRYDKALAIQQRLSTQLKNKETA